MRFAKSILACVALAASTRGEAARPTIHTSTMTVSLPPRATGSAANVYASVITSSSLMTEYLLACQTVLTWPYSCDGDFKGVTLTYAPSSEMDIAFGASTYNCTLASSAVCATKTISANEATTTLDASQSSAWMTAITVLETEKKMTKKPSSTSIAPSSNPNNLKGKPRSEPGSGSSSSDSISDPFDNPKEKSAEFTIDMGILSLMMVLLGIIIGP